VKRFISLSKGDSLRVRLTKSPEDAARLGGLVSPIYPAGGTSPVDVLPRACRISFYAPASPRRRLNELLRTSAESYQGVFVSHGVASIIVIAEESDPIWAVTERWTNDPSESWWIADSELLRSEVHMPDSSADFAMGGVDLSLIPQGIAGQLRQAITNLTALTPIVSAYAPEMVCLIKAMELGVADTASRVKSLVNSGLSEGDLAVISNFHVERIVELNHALSALRNQAFSGVFPLGTSVCSVAEYSLLGIGSAVRGLWRHYEHLSENTSKANLPGRLRSSHQSGGPFNYFKNRTLLDFAEWRDSASGANRLGDAKPETPRLHVPYFSLKGGFRETTHAISAPWQAIHAGASSKWTLLTVCHEFLHSHFRDIFSALFDEGDLEEGLFDRMATAYSKDAATPQESIWGLYVSALLDWDRIRASQANSRKTSVPDAISGPDVRALHREHHRFFSEIVVHTLDYHYTYRGDDDSYVASLWRSWSEVPRVANNLEHYILRTLASLSSSKSDPGWSGPEAFVDAATRMVNVLDRMRTRIPNVDRMLDILRSAKGSERGTSRLQTEFLSARYISQFARHFLYDEILHASLLYDDTTVETDDEGDEVASEGEVPEPPSEYKFNRFEYPAAPVGSPLRFLLDQFGRSDSTTGRLDIEKLTLWQCLVLVEGIQN
jgi:hypothetical protein